MVFPIIISTYRSDSLFLRIIKTTKQNLTKKKHNAYLDDSISTKYEKEKEYIILFLIKKTITTF